MLEKVVSEGPPRTYHLPLQLTGSLSVSVDSDRLESMAPVVWLIPRLYRLRRIRQYQGPDLRGTRCRERKCPECDAASPIENTFGCGNGCAGCQDVVNQQEHSVFGELDSSFEGEGALEVASSLSPTQSDLVAHPTSLHENVAHSGPHPSSFESVNHRAGQFRNRLAPAPALVRCRRRPGPAHDVHPAPIIAMRLKCCRHSFGEFLRCEPEKGRQEGAEIGSTMILPGHDDLSHRTGVFGQRPNRQRRSAIEAIKPWGTCFDPLRATGERRQATAADDDVEGAASGARHGKQQRRRLERSGAPGPRQGEPSGFR